MRTAPAFLNDGGEMGARIRAADWDASPLGQPEHWPQPLKTLVGLMLAAKQPMFIVWGPERLFIYNDAYVDVLADKHPAALGRPFLDVWSEIRGDLEPLAAKVFGGEPVHMEDIALVMVRRGLPEETHFAFSYTPVQDADGTIAGLFCACIETTIAVLEARRQALRLAIEDVLRSDEQVDTMLVRASEALRHHLGVDRVAIGLINGDRDDVDLLDHQGRRRTVAVAALVPHGLASRPFVTDGTEFRPRGTNGIGPETRAAIVAPVRSDGSLRALLHVASSRPRLWSDADVELVEHVAHRLWDAAARDAASRALRESEEHLSGMFANTGAGFAETDVDGQFIAVNDAFCALTGRSRDALLRSDEVSITHDADRDAMRDALARVRGTGAPVTIEKRYACPDGREVWVSDTVTPLRSANGGRSLLSVAIDVTERKAVEQALAAAKELAEEANVAKSTFIANMSHELRTPLSAIIGYSEMMREEIGDGGDPAEFVADMGKIESNARHLLSLINDVLDLSKIESGRMEVFAETIDVAAMVHEVVATVEGLVGRKNNRLALAVAPGLGTAHTDVVKLRQVLLNLLGNAAKFTENGTVSLSVERDGDGMLRFAVRDDGIGMTPEQRANLFQRFTQADASTTRRFGGTGLGLSITKVFVSMLGGTIDVDSVPGQGSTFTVRLPDRAPAPPQDEPAGALAAAAPTPAIRRDTVLVIDDDLAQLELMSRFLEREGFAVRTATDGQAGLALAAELLPCAILLDVTMPGLDGWSVLRTLKADGALAEIPVIMVTFIGDSGLSGALGAAGHVTKPVRWDRFRDVMDRFRDTGDDVLLVDDDPELRRRMAQMLERDGWRVIEAANGREALDHLDGIRPRAVLLDLEMPVMDGFAFLHAFRDRAGCRDIPVVVITARDLTGADRRALRGADRVLRKGDTSLRALSEQLHQVTDASPGDRARQAG